MPAKSFSPAWLERHRVTMPPVSREAIVGLGHVMAELDSLIARLSDVEGAAALGAPLPKGVLFHGEPGTGKTLVARFLASTLDRGVPMYEISADELSPARLRGTMRTLSSSHPLAVLFMDEIDQWAMSRDSGYHDPDTRLVLTGALAAIDGLEASSGVLVIAASNHGPEWLDAALVRPLRLGIHVEFGLPDEGERATLFSRLLEARPLDGPVDVGRLAALTRGSTPAAIVGVVDDAAGMALARGARRISGDDLVAALRRGGRIDAGADIDPAVRRRLAIHEAGHLAVAVALRGVSYLHSSRITSDGGRTEVGDEKRRYQTVPDDELTDLAVIAMAGAAAEQALLGHASLSGTDDIAQASDTAFLRLTAGIDPRLPPVAIDDLRHYLPGSLKRAALEAIGEDLSRARSLAAGLVAVHARAIESLADALDAAGELVGEDLARAMESAGFVSGSRGS